MQLRSESVLRAINNTEKKYNILCTPCHERFSSNLASLPHTFYMLHKPGVTKPWVHHYAKLPDNHILIDFSEESLPKNTRFDIVLSQNKFGNFQIVAPLAQQLNIPLVSLEHTLPVPTWTKKQIDLTTQMRGKVNMFISESSIEKWGFSKDDPSVRVLKHAIDSDKFKPVENGHNDGRILSVVNDLINRDIFCGWNLYQRLTKGLPINPVGDTKGFSEPAKDTDDLISKYQNASVFLNTSLVSPIPMSLLEAASVGAPIVSTNTCEIPYIFTDGIHGFFSNDEGYLRSKLIWCLENPAEAKKLGQSARQLIIERFNLKQHLDTWNEVFEEVIGQGY